MYVIKGAIYKAKDGAYDPERPEYNCYSPADSGDWSIMDCWVCDKQGNIHPGYNVSPVPVNAESLGRIIGSMAGE